MKDQQDVVSVALSGNSASESVVVENIGSENQAEESFEEGEEGEIMVEVVGSDVYVDGVSGDTEGNLDLGDKIEETQIDNVSEAMDVSSEGDGNKVGESVEGPAESLKDGKKLVAREVVCTTLCKSVDVKGDVVSALPPKVSVVDDEVWNPGIEAVGGSSTVSDSEVIGASSVAIVEDKITEVEAFTKDGPAEAVVDGKTETEERKEVLLSIANTASRDQFSSAETVTNSEVVGASPTVIVEEKITEAEAVTKDGATSETLDRSTGAVLDKKTEIEEKKEVLSSIDNTESHDHSTEASPMMIDEEKITEAEAVIKDGSTSESLDRPMESVPDEKTETEEKKEVLPSSDNTASHDQFSSAATVPNSEVTVPSPVEINEEMQTEDEAVTKESADLANPEPLSHPEEAGLEGKTDVEEKQEVLSSTDDSAKCVASYEVKELSPMVINEEKSTEDEAVTKECADLVTPEPLNHPEETDLDEKTDIEEKKEVLPSADDSAKCAATDEVTGPSLVVISEEKSSEDEAVNKDSADLVTPEPMSHPIEAVSEIPDTEVIKEVLPSSDNSANPDDINADPVMSREKTASQPAVEIEEKKEVLSSSDTSANRDHVDADSVMSHEETNVAQSGVEPPEISLDSNGDGVENVQVDGTDSIVEEARLVDASDGQDPMETDTQEDGMKAEVATADGDGSIDEKSVDDKEIFPAENKTSILESDAQISDVQDDQVDGVSHTGNGECLGTDAELETHKALENQVLSDEPNKLTVVDSDKSLNVEIQEDKIETETNTMSSGVSLDKEIVQVDSGMNSDQPFGTTVGSEIDGQDAVILEAVDEDGSCEKVIEIKSEIPAVDDSAENMQLVEEGVCSKVETEDLVAVEDHVVGQDAILNSEGFTKQEVSEQITETSNHEVGKIEDINSMPNEVAPVSDTAEVCISPERTEKVGPVEEVNILENKSIEEDNKPKECNGFGTIENYTSEKKVMDVEKEQESDAELEAEGPSETEKSKLSTEEKLKHTSSFRMSQSGYLTPPENEGAFAQSDLVWGKVRSHPWWPGQIFDPDDASEKAVKYHKKDSYLVAYFGDQTFAWNDSSALKPFRPNFTQIEKQSSSEAFHNAVTCALEEVERRVELGLACSCIPKDDYAKIETQVVENTGIRDEASQRFGVDQSTRAFHFEPDKLVDYITGLATRACSRPDRLDLVIAQAQLSAFCRFKGYRSLTKFPSSGELLESDADTEKVKRRHVSKEGSQSKERSLVDLMEDRGEYSLDEEDELGADDLGKSVGKKRKALDPLADVSEKRVTVYAAKVSTSAIQSPKPSFKIGECIRRVASQLTGSTPSIKDEMAIDGSLNVNEHSEKQSAVVSAESLSVSEMLSRIELVALNPKKRHGIHNNIRAFFLGFRNSVAINRRGRKKKSEQTVGGSGEEFEFDDVNDSYWTDRIVQNYPEEQHEGENGGANLQVVPFSGEKPVKTGRKPHSRKRFSSGASPTVHAVEDESAKRRKQETSPAELILNFAERNRVPSEINLNKMFRRFGPLMESETEVDHESGCAKVIFKRGSDAEVARNSAEKFSIFGPALVNYQIGYSPVISVKILPVAMPQPLDEETLMV